MLISLQLYKRLTYYLTAILNSTAPNELMKDFQARGLFGARHVYIYKKKLDIFYPKFNLKDKIHLQLAKLSEQAPKKTTDFLSDKSSGSVSPKS